MRTFGDSPAVLKRPKSPSDSLHTWTDKKTGVQTGTVVCFCETQLEAYTVIMFCFLLIRVEEPRKLNLDQEKAPTLCSGRENKIHLGGLQLLKASWGRIQWRFHRLLSKIHPHWNGFSDQISVMRRKEKRKNKNKLTKETSVLSKEVTAVTTIEDSYRKAITDLFDIIREKHLKQTKKRHTKTKAVLIFLCRLRTTFLLN